MIKKNYNTVGTNRYLVLKSYVQRFVVKGKNHFERRSYLLVPSLKLSLPSLVCQKNWK